MPIYDPDHIEYSISHGNVHLVMDGGRRVPAYWAHPAIGRKFPAVAIAHDWWGLTDITRRLANLFAMMGHYVIVPDLFNGQRPKTAKEAIELVKKLERYGYPLVDEALSVLEAHHQCNKSVAAVGIGMGGSLAFEAAITRPDLEAAVAYGGFPQRYLGRFKEANTPIFAFYGEHEPYTKPATVERLRRELEGSLHDLPHQVEVVKDLGHEFFDQRFNDAQRERSRRVFKQSLGFLDQHLQYPAKPTRQVI